MTNTLTQTDICNMALDIVGGMNIQNIEDQSNPNALLCKRHWGQCVRAEISKYEWVFARTVVTPQEVDYTAYPEAQINGYIAYHLPADFSRLSLYFFSEMYPYRKNQYDLGHNYFLTSDYLYTRYPLTTLPYISFTTPIAKWDTLFCDVLAAALAIRIGRKIMGADEDVSFLYSIYRQNVSDARRKQVLQMEPSGTGTTETQRSRLVYYGGF